MTEATVRPGDPVLEVRDLRTWFHTDQGTVKAVDGVSFDVRAGETLGVVGESGCGKTVTSLSILDLLPRPVSEIQEGSSIRFQGEELIGASTTRMRSLRGNDISMIFQEPMSSLNPVFTVGEQIAESIRLHRGLNRAEAKQEVIRLLEQVGISDAARRVDAHPHELSGGMRQRVMIAMALACDPVLLIADEPTTALDVTIQAQILELLANIRSGSSMAVMLVTHDLGVVAEVCDRVVVMYAGQIVERGSVFDIFERPSHPYTKGLLRSLPSLAPPGGRLDAIPGTVPDPRRWPAGCRFHDRCPEAADACRVPQEIVVLDDERTARCWRAGP